jgi:hypothetical protein
MFMTVENWWKFLSVVATLNIVAWGISALYLNHHYENFLQLPIINSEDGCYGCLQSIPPAVHFGPFSPELTWSEFVWCSQACRICWWGEV